MRMVIAGAAALLLAAGCSQNTIQSAQQDTSKNVAQANHDLAQAGRDLKPKLDELALGTRVTAALKANANLPAGIHAWASPGGVVLRGTVASAQQKDLAGQVARQTLPADKTVSNQITVKP